MFNLTPRKNTTTFEMILQIHLALLATIGTLFLGLAQGSLALPCLTLLAATIAITFTDILGWFQLPRPAANLAAVFAVMFSLLDLQSSESQNQLIAIANLLTYLQLVLLFQEKHDRLNWQLITLSLLQVVVSAALNLGISFGLLTLVYITTMFSTLTLFFVVRETQRFTNRDALSHDPNDSEKSKPAAPATKVRNVPPWQQALGREPKTEFSLSRQTTLRDFFDGGVAAQVSVAMIATLLFSAIMFYVAPRVKGTNWQGGRPGRIRTVGFSPQISLGEMGEVLQDPTVAMRVSLYDNDGRPYKLLAPPYFCGAILMRYGREDAPGRWASAAPSGASVAPEPPQNAELVKQVFRLEPTIEPNLFSVFPVHRLGETTREVKLDRRVGQLYRDSATSPTPVGPFQYIIGTSGFRNGIQLPLVPIQRRTDSPRRWEYWMNYRLALLEFDPDRFPHLQRLATAALREANALDADNATKARVLEKYFAKSGKFKYSLTFKKRTNPSVDPIEDFVANHRSGHCEYFASALALMLRSQGVPARLIVGYHGGEYNRVGNYWLVRQSDAHAWVEAMLDPKDILDFPGDVSHVTEGAWLRLDPTPGNPVATEEQMIKKMWNFSDLFGYAQFLWNDYVLGLNSDRQRANILDPISDASTQAATQLTSVDGWRDWFKQQSSKKIHHWQLEDWFSWRAATLAMLVSACCLAIYNAVQVARGRQTRARRLFERIRGLFSPNFENMQRQVEFYHRFETLLSRHGFRRERQQTAQEFAVAVGASAEFESQPAFATAASRIVAAFYQIRFGKELIPNNQLAELEADLRTIESITHPSK